MQKTHLSGNSKGFEALCQGRGIRTRYILYYMIVGICESNKTLSIIDLQVSLKLKPEDKGFRFGKKVLMDGRIKVS